MKRFRFSLERVLRLKKQMEKMAELRLQQAQAAVRKCEEEVANLRNELARMASATDLATVAQEFRWGGWSARRDMAEQLAQALSAAERTLNEAKRKAQEAQSAWARCVQEVEVILSLRQRQEQEHAHELAGAEQLERDERGLLRWIESNDAEEGE